VLLRPIVLGPLSALTLLLSILVLPVATFASFYTVSVTRVAQNAYRDSSTRLVIITSSCSESTSGDDATYDDSSGGPRGRLIFNGGSTCDVRGIYQSNANLTRVDQDLYKDSSGQGYLRTRFCYAYAYGEDTLILNDSVIFLNSHQRCDVDPSR
jgi:hypothetical protein